MEDWDRTVGGGHDGNSIGAGSVERLQQKDKDGAQYMVSNVSNKKFSSFQHIFI